VEEVEEKKRERGEGRKGAEKGVERMNLDLPAKSAYIDQARTKVVVYQELSPWVKRGLRILESEDDCIQWQLQSFH